MCTYTVAIPGRLFDDVDDLCETGASAPVLFLYIGGVLHAGLYNTCVAGRLEGLGHFL
jgi:hypothetical protein